MRRSAFPWSSLAALFGGLALAAAESRLAPVPDPAVLAQLDFWVGEWTVAWTDADGKRHEGTNTISRILDGKVLHEQFSAPPMDFRGESFSVYDARAGQWKQTWVDNTRGYLDFVGRQDEDRFIFERSWTAPDGERRENRMVFHSISADALIWDWEGRKAGDDEWKRLWRLEYARK